MIEHSSSKRREVDKECDGVEAVDPVTTVLGKRQLTGVITHDGASNSGALHVGYRRRKVMHNRIDYSAFEYFYGQKKFSGLHLEASTACKEIARLVLEQKDSEEDSLALNIVRYLNNNAFLPYFHIIFDFFALERTESRLEKLFRLDIVKEFWGKFTEKFNCKK